MERERMLPNSRRIIDVVRRANQIATITQLDDLLDRTLDLLLEVAEAEAGTLYLCDPASDELIFRVVKGDAASKALVGRRIRTSQGLAGASLRANEPIFVADVARDPRWTHDLGGFGKLKLRTAYSLPLLLQGRAIGVVQVFNLTDSLDEEKSALLELLVNYRLGTAGTTREREARDGVRRDLRGPG